MSVPHYVYKHLSKNGDVLYIGCTGNLRSRRAHHQTQSIWFKHVYEIKHTKYKDRESALAAEKRLIQKHSPMFNIVNDNKYNIAKSSKSKIIPLFLTDDQYTNMQILSIFKEVTYEEAIQTIFDFGLEVLKKKSTQDLERLKV